MESQRYAAKIFLPEGTDVPKEDLILFFHRVIQDHLLDEVTIDVTDYSHVQGGPGVMLLCHEAFYSMDRGGGRLGLKVATKRGATGSTEDRIRRVLGKLLRLARVMEDHEIFAGRLRFDAQNLLLSIEDRLLAPSSQATFDAFAPALAAVATRVWGAPPLLVRAGSPKEPFQVELSLEEAKSTSELLAALAAC